MVEFVMHRLFPIICNMSLTASVVIRGGAGGPPAAAAGTQGLFLRPVGGGAVPVAVPGVRHLRRVPDGGAGRSGRRSGPSAPARWSMSRRTSSAAAAPDGDTFPQETFPAESPAEASSAPLPA